MIFARDKSQMCNNLLQFAHVYAWAREHGRSVMSMRFSYKYRYFLISDTPYTSFPLYLCAKVLAALRILPTASFKHRDCNPQALEAKMLRHRHIVVSGWFVRYYDLFLKYRDEICRLFTIKPEITAPVKARMAELEQRSGNAACQSADKVRLGVHIRRGDYAQWAGGRFYYDDEVYATHIIKFATFHPNKEVHAYLSTNDRTLTTARMEERLKALSPRTAAHIHLHQMKDNIPPQDLFMLSECDYVIGPPSTFSLVATMYRDIPFYRMDKKNVESFVPEAFNTFSYWFRRINEL